MAQTASAAKTTSEIKSISDESTLFGYIGDILKYSHNPVLPITSKDMDDCALMKISDTESLAITSDFVRGSGFTLFKLGLMNYYDAGYYLIGANLSDLASVGAKPVGLTTILRYSDAMGDDEFKQVFQGMRDAADAHGAQIIGGDIGSYNSDVFAATAFGLVKTENALLRKNVQDGDLLCVTGIVGRPMTAMTYFKEIKKTGFELSEQEENEILDSWRRVSPRVKEGLLLSKNKLANACQDVSDGLKATIEQMAKLSGKNFTVYADKIPMHPATVKLANHLGIDPVQIAVSASVDFELLFTVPGGKKDECLKLFTDNDLKMTVIGEVNGEGRNIMIDADGNKKDLPGITWNQQKGNFVQDVLKK